MTTIVTPPSTQKRTSVQFFYNPQTQSLYRSAADRDAKKNSVVEFFAKPSPAIVDIILSAAMVEKWVLELGRLLGDSLAGWQGEEDSVQDEHAELIADTDTVVRHSDRWAAFPNRPFEAGPLVHKSWRNWTYVDGDVLHQNNEEIAAILSACTETERECILRAPQNIQMLADLFSSLAENGGAWDDEEDSVQEEKAGLIRRIDDAVGAAQDIVTRLMAIELDGSPALLGNALREQALELLKQAHSIDGLSPFMVTHHHRHGEDVNVVWSAGKPSTDEAVRLAGVDFEPGDDQEETIEIDNIFLPEMTGWSQELSELQNTQRTDLMTLVEDPEPEDEIAAPAP